MNNKRPETIFCDIDGTILKHKGDICFQHIEPKLLDGVLDKFREWDIRGCKIILVTGRRESTRKATEKSLCDLGIFYDQLVMGVGGGKRILINDKKDDGEETAIAVNLKRNEGLKNVSN